MTSDGKKLKHTQVNRTSFRLHKWDSEKNIASTSFETALMRQRPEIEDEMEHLARTLARVYGLDEVLKHDGPLMMQFFAKFTEACIRQKKKDEDWIIVHM
jgi:hypothetical protein